MCYAICMKRTTVMLPDELDARLRLEARRRGVSIADVARHAIEQELPQPADSGHLAFFAIGEGGPDDASERVDQLVRQAIDRRHTSPPR
jgi:predicted transcriptional regulator